MLVENLYTDMDAPPDGITAMAYELSSHAIVAKVAPSDLESICVG